MGTSAKRNRSMEEVKESKRRKSSDGKPKVSYVRSSSSRPSTSTVTLNKMPLNEIMKQHLKVSLVDTSREDLKISSENYVILDTKIVDEIIKKRREGVINTMPQFDMSERFFGYRVITAKSIDDLDTLRRLVQDMGEVWPGAKIEVRNLSELPRPPKVKVVIPGEHKQPAKILEVMEITNPELKISGWSVINNIEHKNGRTVVIFRITQENLAALVKNNMKLCFGLHSIPVVLLDAEQQKEITVDKEMESH